MMIPDSDAVTAVTVPPDTLPEFWPMESPPTGEPEAAWTAIPPAYRVTVPAVPVRHVWIPWPLAVVLAPLFWIMPGRSGPHFARAGYLAAISAHLFWIYYGIFWPAVSEVMQDRSLLGAYLGLGDNRVHGGRWPEPTLSEVLRAPLAVLTTTSTRWSSEIFTVLAVLGSSIFFVEVVALGISLCVLPYATAGEPLKRAFGRSLRLTWWSLTALTVVGMTINLIGIRIWRLEPIVFIFSLSIVWLLSLLIRSSQGYTGRPEGVEWEPISPQCDRCGYGLTALPYNTICPECGLTVQDSFPDKRRPSRFAAAGLFGRLTVYFPTWLAILYGRRFFRSLQTRGEHPAAVRFAVWTCVLTSLLVSVPIIMMTNLDIREKPLFMWDSLSEWSSVSLAFAITLAVMLAFLAAVALVWSRFGYQPLNRYSTVVFYWSAWLLPICTTAAGTVLLFERLLNKELVRWIVHVPTMGTMDLYGVICMVPMAVPLALGIHSIVRLNRALNETRYANA